VDTLFSSSNRDRGSVEPRMEFARECCLLSSSFSSSLTRIEQLVLGRLYLRFRRRDSRYDDDADRVIVQWVALLGAWSMELH
jgi:hypothetical protein